MFLQQSVILLGHRLRLLLHGLKVHLGTVQFCQTNGWCCDPKFLTSCSHSLRHWWENNSKTEKVFFVLDGLVNTDHPSPQTGTTLHTCLEDSWKISNAASTIVFTSILWSDVWFLHTGNSYMHTHIYKLQQDSPLHWLWCMSALEVTILWAGLKCEGGTISTKWTCAEANFSPLKTILPPSHPNFPLLLLC